MPDQLQLRGGTTVEHSTFIGASKEVTVDTTKKTVVVHDGTTAGGIPVMREDASNSALGLGSAGTPSIKFTGDLDTGIYSPGANQVAVATNGTERLRITAAGLVGIGTSAPDARLEVNDQSSGAETFPLYVSNQGTGVGTRATIRFDVANSYYGSIGGGEESGIGSSLVIDAPSSSGLIRFTKNNKATELARFNDNGRLGIGTSAPSSVLHCVGSKDAVNFTIGASLSTVGGGAFANYSQITFANTAGGNSDAAIRAYGNVWNSAGAELGFFTSNNSAPTEAMRIKSTGIINFSNAPTYADNTTAAAAGLAVGDVYKTVLGVLMIRY
jgi:hypothetical protein